MSFSPSVRPSSLYIHWPFCPYKCHFCDFVALASHDHYMPQYHEALKAELNAFFDRYTDPLQIKTIYFGGGTPSTYPNDLLLDTFDTLKNRVRLDPEVEITIEANPGTIHEQQLDLWRSVGINRVSLGVQVLNDAVLQGLNRHQKSTDVLWAVDALAKRFSNYSVDLILGLPGISKEQWERTVAKVMEWPVAHISMYFLMVQENTPLYFKVKKDAISLPCDDDVVDLYYWTCEQFAQHGFEQYEISSFAREGKYARHNMVYWQHKPYKGFGIGACSFDGAARSQNSKNLLEYLQTSTELEEVTAFAETLSPRQRFVESVMLRLRQTRGAVLRDLIALAPQDCKTAFIQKLNTFIAQNLVISEGDRVRLSPRALALENEIITQLVTE